MITDALCGRRSEPPADPGRAGALAALVVRELAHRLFLDGADVRIAEFTRRLHQHTGADQRLDAALRGLLGGSSPAVADPLTPLLVLGRGLVLELGLDDQAVAEMVGRLDEQVSDRSAIAETPPTQEPPTAEVPAAPADPVPPPTGVGGRAPGRSGRIGYLVGGILATFGVLALVAGLILPIGAGGDDPPADDAPAPQGSDPGQVTQAFADAVNSERFARARTLLCPGASRMTRHVAGGLLRVQQLSVDRVETRNSTTAYLLAKAAIDPRSEPLAWRGTLRTIGGSWCMLDIHPEDASPPGQPETRDVAFEKMRSFVILISQGDSAKAMTYACGTSRRRETQAIVDIAIGTGARLAVKPDSGLEGAAKYTGSVTGRSRWQRINGDVTIRRADNGTYCISSFEIAYE